MGPCYHVRVFGWSPGSHRCGSHCRPVCHKLRIEWHVRVDSGLVMERIIWIVCVMQDKILTCKLWAPLHHKLQAPLHCELQAALQHELWATLHCELQATLHCKLWAPLHCKLQAPLHCNLQAPLCCKLQAPLCCKLQAPLHCNLLPPLHTIVQCEGLFTCGTSMGTSLLKE